MEPEIKIHLVELATKLANERTFEQLTSEYMGEGDVIVEDDGTIKYTKYAQEIFDNWYDYYYDFINKYKI